MRFTSAVLAVLATLAFALPLTAHASTVQPQLAVASICGQGSHLFDIRNAGTSTTSFLYYRITARAADGMPAIKTWILPLFPMTPGEVFRLSVPQAAWGLHIAVEVVANPVAGNVIAASNGTVAYPNFCW